MAESPPTAKRTGILARVVRAVTFLVTIGVVALVAAWWASRPAQPDAFYQIALPPTAEPGTLLRSEPFQKAVPAGARAWRFLYVTRRADNSLAVASAVVVASERSGGAPRPVIAWAHGTTGIAPGCAPSLMANPFANVPAVDQIIREDWIYVAADYPGLGTAGGHAYLVGDDAARAVLDSVRAARRLQGVALDDRVVVWGHSQGGNSALWTGMRASEYASNVKILGVAALAPASDLKSLVAASRSSMFGKIVTSYLVHAYSAAYPDVRAIPYVRRRASILVDDIASRCVGEWGTLLSMLQSTLLSSDGIFAQDPTSGPLGARLLENTPQGPIAAPVLIAQGEADDLVLPDIQKRYASTRCTAGQPIDYRSYAGLDHVSLVAAASPLAADLIAWSRDRFAGAPAPNTCRR